jgi:hypothetical protein
MIGREIRIALLAVGLTATACQPDRAYDKGVSEFEPVYCYQTLGTPDCYAEPIAQFRPSLINFYGPAPQKYDPPEPLEMQEPQAPPKIERYVRDAEPVPGSEPRRASPSEEQPPVATGEPRYIGPLP